jgi:predicted O-linked N-acetylglucosamine transferase (SPINDLY family)
MGKIRKKVKEENRVVARKTPLLTNELLSELLAEYSAQNFTRAEQLAVSLTKKYPRHPFPWKVLGAIFQQTLRLEEALEIKKRIILIAPNDPEAQLNLSNAQRELGRFKDAEESCRRAITLRPSMAEAFCSLAVILQNQGGRDSEAEDSLRHAIHLDPSNSNAHGNLGNFLKKIGKTHEAEECYRRVIQLNPGNPQAHTNLGNLLKDNGDYEEAVKAHLEAIRIKPDYAEAHSNLGNVFLTQGLFSEAEEQYGIAIRLKPTYALAYSNLGNVLREMGRLDEAEGYCREAIKLQPDLPEALGNLANVLKDTGRLAEAEENYLEALKQEKQYQNIYVNYGNLLKDLGRFKEAEGIYRKAIQLQPESAIVLSNFALILRSLNRIPEAEAVCRNALRMDPNLAVAHNNLSIILSDQGRFYDAEVSCREAMRLNPEMYENYSNLGYFLRALGRYSEAEACCRRALLLKSDYSAAYTNLARVIQETGGLAEAVSCYREAIRLSPDNLVYRDNLLFAVNYDDQLSAEDVYKEYENYHSAISRIIGGFKYSHVGRAIGKSGKIRLGYSSPDFTGHSVHLFIEPILKNHDRSRFEIYAYANVKVPDAHTERMKGYFDSWVDVCAMSDEGIAQRIFDDQIDILVDLAGHTVGNRLPVFARCPAPIQVGLLLGAGYTTGLKEIDYIIGDEYITPRGSEPYFSEQIWRVPAPQFCYQPHAENIPEVNELPALVKGYLTFGSLSRTVRINDRLLKVWGSILAKTPNSRLRLDQQLFIDENTRNIFMDRLERLGISRDRVELTCSRPHWRAYHDIDISLDCFPHNAGTTTFDSLWMGVPVLTKLDRPSVGRFGVSILEPLGLSNWVAETEEVYINKAVAFARNLEELVFLRSTLRDRLAKSSLMKPDELASKIEAAYLGMVGAKFSIVDRNT